MQVCVCLCVYVGERKFFTYLNLAVKPHRTQSLSKHYPKASDMFNIFEFSFNPNKDSTNNKNTVKYGDFLSHIGCHFF